MANFRKDKFSLLVDGGMHGVSEKLVEGIHFAFLGRNRNCQAALFAKSRPLRFVAHPGKPAHFQACHAPQAFVQINRGWRTMIETAIKKTSQIERGWKSHRWIEEYFLFDSREAFASTLTLDCWNLSYAGKEELLLPEILLPPYTIGK